MASLLAAFSRPDQSSDPLAGPSEVKRKKIPKVAVYVSGATFAITLGLTALILPYARQAARMARPPPEFRSNRNILLKRPAPNSTITPPGPGSISSVSGVRGGDGHDSGTIGSKAAMEAETVGEQEERGEPVSGFMAFQALGIATAVVFGSAGLGAWVVAKLLGVNDMDGFAAKMREGLDQTMPGLTGGMRKHGSEPDELGDFLDDMAKEPEELEAELQRTIRTDPSLGRPS